jgi:hypothetical protein
LLISVSHCTTPLNFEMAALTLTTPALTSTALALWITLEAAFMVIPFVLSSTELPLLSVSTTAPVPGPSLERELLAAGRLNDDALPAALIVERDLHTVTGPHKFLVVGDVHRLRRRVGAIPQATFVANIGNKPGPAVGASHQGGDPCPCLVAALSGHEHLR